KWTGAMAPQRSKLFAISSALSDCRWRGTSLRASSTGSPPRRGPRGARIVRLRSDIWVAAYLRRCGAEGASAVLRRRGAAEAAAIFIKIELRDGWAVVYGPAPQSAAPDAERGVERVFARAHRPDRIPSRDADKRLEREIAFDPDLWIIEVENTEGRCWLDL